MLVEAGGRWRQPLAVQGRRLRISIDEPSLSVGVPASVIREIADVLLDNALRHGRGAVNVHARVAGASIAVDVSDEGTREALDSVRIFERRSPGARGHGIGLAFAQSLADAEGGRLELGSHAPTTFTLFLPNPIDKPR